jgi:hypothetical protein
MGSRHTFAFIFFFLSKQFNVLHRILSRSLARTHQSCRPGRICTVTIRLESISLLFFRRAMWIELCLEGFSVAIDHSAALSPTSFSACERHPLHACALADEVIDESNIDADPLLLAKSPSATRAAAALGTLLQRRRVTSSVGGNHLRVSSPRTSPRDRFDDADDSEGDCDFSDASFSGLCECTWIREKCFRFSISLARLALRRLLPKAAIQLRHARLASDLVCLSQSYRVRSTRTCVFLNVLCEFIFVNLCMAARFVLQVDARIYSRPRSHLERAPIARWSLAAVRPLQQARPVRRDELGTGALSVSAERARTRLVIV